MKAILHVEGSNKGGAYLSQYNNQEIDIRSLYKDIEVNSAPLSIIQTNDAKQHTCQLVDVRFIDEHIFIQGFVMNDSTETGGKVLMRLTPIQ
jgi:hypothetical protein